MMCERAVFARTKHHLLTLLVVSRLAYYWVKSINMDSQDDAW